MCSCSSYIYHFYIIELFSYMGKNYVFMIKFLCLIIS